MACETDAKVDANACETDAQPMRNTHGTDAKVDAKPHRNLSASGSRLSEDWKPTDVDWHRAQQELGSTVAREQLQIFRDHWRAQAGQKGRKADWHATWRNWVRRHNEFGSSRGNGRRPVEELPLRYPVDEDGSGIARDFARRKGKTS